MFSPIHTIISRVQTFAQVRELLMAAVICQIRVTRVVFSVEVLLV